MEQNDTRYELGAQVGFLLRLASQRHSMIFQETLPDITPTQFSVLIRLFEVGKCSQNELGRQTAMDQATVMGVVGRLRAKGLVELVADPTDKRRCLVSIPKKHWSMKADLHAKGHAITRKTLQTLSRSEQATFLKLVAKLT